MRYHSDLELVCALICEIVVIKIASVASGAQFSVIGRLMLI
jgi:hypothetical protein